MKLTCWLYIIICICSCNSNDTNTDSAEKDSNTGTHAGATDTIALSTIGLRDGCYEMIMKRDTAALRITLKDSTITGQLDYRWSEKDQNTGTIHGVIRDSLIIADYTFQSEGMTSLREMVFKITGNTLLQGFGELKEENGKVVFVNKNKLQFTNANPFIRVDCDTAETQ
jgi:hypothetical protein